jgi:predicted Zn-dependent protease
MQTYFNQLAAAVCTNPTGIDRTTLYMTAEDSDFIRFNHGAVRQATHVTQRYGTVAVIAGQKRAESTVTLSGDLAQDTALLTAERDALAAQIAFVPDDPFLLLPDAVNNTQRQEQGQLPSAAQVIGAVAQHAAQLDFVGLYAGGPVAHGFADSRGQRNWHHTETFHFEWCLYHSADKAVKSTYAGARWDAVEFASRVAQGAQRMRLLAQPAKTLAPGAYRVYFTPAAMGELLGTLCWGGFGLKDRKTKTSTLIKLEQGEAALAGGVHMREAGGTGSAPVFTSTGFVKPAQVELIAQGKSANALASPRSAKEFGVHANADTQEYPTSLMMDGGTLAQTDALRALGTGVYVSNLHYLNYSDRQTCRMTGMTRFACFWVENGQLAAPINVMRFDDSVLRMLGDGLEALTQEVEFMPNSDTYQARQLASISAPGAIVRGFAFTL